MRDRARPPLLADSVRDLGYSLDLRERERNARRRFL